MLDSIYIGLTGLIGYSKDLSVIGNNVANVNTTGFKSSQLVFSDLFYRSQFGDGGAGGSGNRLDFGSGLATGSTRLLFAQGELRQSGNDQDVAIDGNGFFVLRRDGRTFYTRSGQFSFDADGWLVAAASGARVAAFAGGALSDINVTGQRTNAGKATTKASFAGVLNAGAAASAPVSLGNVVVHDSAGTAHTISLTLTNNATVAAGSWLLEVREGDNVLASGEIRFNADGTPAAGFNSVRLPLAPEGIAATDVELNFGDPGSTSGVRSITAASSTVQLATQDGFAVGSLTRATFDDQGFLSLIYSNGQTTKGERLALASFASLQELQPLEGNLFEPGAEQAAALGVAGEGVFGKAAPRRVELSNVELSQEFGNLIISQRGYQASSQVISTANEMVQQLFDIKARR